MKSRRWLWWVKMNMRCTKWNIWKFILKIKLRNTHYMLYVILCSNVYFIKYQVKITSSSESIRLPKSSRGTLKKIIHASHKRETIVANHICYILYTKIHWSQWYTAIYSWWQAFVKCSIIFELVVNTALLKNKIT